MNKKTVLILISAFLLVFITIYILYIIETKNKELEFYAVIVDANKQNYLVSPFNENDFVNKYSEISIKLDEGLQVGDIVKLKVENIILETYPPIMRVISYKLVYPKYNTQVIEEVPYIENELIN